MKLKNLLFATMVACAFTACSNEDDPIVGPVTPEGEAAEASIAFSTSIDGVRTKAATTDEGLAAESKVNTLTVIAFNGDGAFLGSGTAKFETTPESKKYDVPAFKVKLATGATEMGVKVLAIANMDAAVFTNKSLTEVCAMPSTLEVAASTGTDNKGFIMSSDVILGNVAADKVAVFGRAASTDAAKNEVAANAAPIYLYRLAARVDMKNISVKFDQATDLKDAIVQIDNVFMLNVRESSLLASTTAGGATVANTAAGWLAGLSVDKTWGNGFLAVGTHTANAYLNQAVSTEGDKKQIIANSANLSLDINKSFYVLETGDANDQANPAIAASTILVIKTTLFANSGDTKGKTKYYSIKVNKDGLTATADGKVHRNTIYKIATATLSGSGSDTPTTVDASYQIAAQVEVMPWNVVEQAPDIE